MGYLAGTRPGIGDSPVYLHALGSCVANRTQCSHVALGREREENAVRGGLQEAGLVGMVPKVPGVGLPRMQPSWMVLEIKNILQSVYFH